MNVRAKFRVVSVTEHDGGDKARTIKLAPRYDETIPEDQLYHKATPTGELSMYVTNPAVIEHLKVGKDFYLDLTPVE